MATAMTASDLERLKSNQEVIWVYLLRMFVIVFTRVYNSSLTWATSIPSLTSHSTSSSFPGYIFQSTPSPGCIQFRAFWYVKPYCLIDVHWRFEGTSCFHIQGRRLRQQVSRKRTHLPRYTASHAKRPYAYLRTYWKKFYKITASFFGVTYLTMHQPFSSNSLLMIQEFFDVITSFSAVYIWSWTTAHRDTRTVPSGP